MTREEAIDYLYALKTEVEIQIMLLDNDKTEPETREGFDLVFHNAYSEFGYGVKRIGPANL